jgi:hypothetical protein
LRSASVANTGPASAGATSVSHATVRALNAFEPLRLLSCRSRSVNFTGKVTPVIACTCG